MSQYADRFTALIDACVLAGALRRNILLSLAEAGLFRPRWSARILDETGIAKLLAPFRKQPDPSASSSHLASIV